MKPETKEALSSFKSRLSGHKYVALVLLVGLVLLLLPTSVGGGESSPAPEPEPAAGPDVEYDERRLEEILSLIDGAGEVRVLLTLETDGERVLARESERSSDTRGGESSESSTNSALVVDLGGGQSGEVEIKYLYPRYRGAVVAARGAGSAAVRSELLEAVKAATGLGGEAVKIVKMG